ncbi:helix-turn-helix domain-containing protein [Maribacter thermophilus]|uniref:helix-turn-helix domain-containing protein n=1 Tax=Maribacter thermophilus TaxID=1197874 RepID=UPI00069BE1C1|nr:helix-turn-helix domain-containing protein [Maribacter thermophilus]
MENPFEIINERLNRIEALLEKLVLQQEGDIDKARSKPMTSLELSTYLNLSVYTIYGLVHKRSLPFIKKGRRLYFEKKEIDKWLMQGRQMTKDDLNLKVDEYLMRNPR